MTLELYQRIEHLLGKNYRCILVEEEVLLLGEGVAEAALLAKAELRSWRRGREARAGRGRMGVGYRGELGVSDRLGKKGKDHREASRGRQTRSLKGRKGRNSSRRRFCRS